ncbi:class I SAM-dependent methyltransferase [Streptomyces sp. NBC_01185]|uniref:class I SAM-dependent methyltransferase n=1 Tax=Streptomyces sp. NBC_01185 TaxID=2903764 RepID=UPI0038660CE0|nr:methyltransferase domain-containing protein [Streptomyces sp. NBC_01185]
MTSESDTVETWNVYGAHQLARGLELTELDRWDWGIREVGPGIEALGDVNGLRVLDLGSGLGRHAAHLAARGADVTAVDASPPSTSVPSPATGTPRVCTWCALTP